ncbi:hypothetical protein QAD02_017710 [Eretmocerus hayati]|uniref:Uncharacterized protein n=1 Tax=Eretmocerus hayati TaxID=131215 RepID=A0ACC2PFS4_9HYME|nr:hypothetical protein QAD02_017710 [Eretmocerus hayati]
MKHLRPVNQSIGEQSIKRSGMKIQSMINTAFPWKNFKTRKIVSQEHEDHSKEESDDDLIDDPEVEECELKYASVSNYLNMSHLSSENLFKFLKDAVPDSEIIQKSKLDRRKLAAILRDIIAPAQRKRLASILKGTDFVICIDGSTDITELSSIRVFVR